MNIWIDVVNSPQVLFFRPILKELQKRGHTLFITSRDYAQTCSLAEDHQIPNTPVGQHGGKNWGGILYHNMDRVSNLCKWVRTQPKIDLAISHNSYTQALASRMMGIPLITLMDYEYQPLNHLCFRLAQRVIVPSAFPDEMLVEYGAKGKVKKYSGIKEEIYLSDFNPDEKVLSNLNVDPQKIVIVVRPPATWTLYHRFENPLFDLVLKYLTVHKDNTIIFLPRVETQAVWAKQLGIPQLIIPSNTLDGPNLLFAADIVISAGGTMNREAAVLGTPTYTVFGGKLGAVDDYLIKKGRMVPIKNNEDLDRIKLEKKKRQGDFSRAPQLVAEVVDYILGG